MKEEIYKYQREYENSSGCFWDTSPAKYVWKFIEIRNLVLDNLKVLDLGAGEGKNAVFLANLNANVTAVDTSKVALKRFPMQPNYQGCKDRIKIINEDIRELYFAAEHFDVIIAYGVLHCLDSKREILTMINNVESWLKPGGYFICATFTDRIPIPEFQSYLTKEAFLAEGELEKKLDNFRILEAENSVITETHSTSNIEHQHSIVRIIAKKNERLK